MSATEQKTAGGRLTALLWLFAAAAFLALPLFAHGCHGDDVDHEPLLVPVRMNPESP